MKPILSVLMLLLYPVTNCQRLVPPRRYNYDNDEEVVVAEKSEEADGNNATGAGSFLGAPCEDSCSANLAHVYCNPITKTCDCEKKYPVKLNDGCGKPKRLNEQCYYKESCMFSDQHSSCIQIHHNAICQCIEGYHAVTIQKPSKRTFCAEDLVVMTKDFSTLAGVISGIALLSGLICFVLRLFNENLYIGRHRYGNANLAPPILFSSDGDFTGSLPLPIHEHQRSASASRASSNPTYASVASRRASAVVQTYRGASRAGAARAAAILLLSYQVQIVPTGSGTASGRLIAESRLDAYYAGSRRPSLASAHSNTSIRSYSAKRYEREREQKEEREMQKRLSRMTSLTNNNSSGKIPPTPSPHSTDDLLPTLEEVKQVPPLAIQEESSSSFQEELPSTSKQ